ncbi:MAG: glycosyltransferase family 4 protein, partial [Xanthobacteraceae bacterium]
LTKSMRDKIASSAMKITYGVCGRFHAFALAAQMEKLGVLERVYCADKSWGAPFGVPPSKFQNRWDIAIRQRAARYIPTVRFNQRKIEAQFDEWLLRRVRCLRPGVLHGWNLHVRRTFQALKGEGWKLCLERSCPHNVFQDELLKEEASRLGLHYHSDPRTLAEATEELYLADIISAPSRYSAKSYSDPALQAKLRVNPLGSNFAMRSPFSRPREPLRVLMVGNDFLRKGTHYLIEAFRLIKEPTARLKIRGNVPKKYESLILDSRIQIIKAVTKSQLDGLYRWANVFCLPSIDEGFGLVTLEAMAYGLPLVVTDNVGSADVLDPSVTRVVPIRDPHAIEEGIRWASLLEPDHIWHAASKVLEDNSWTISGNRQLRDVYLA